MKNGDDDISHDLPMTFRRSGAHLGARPGGPLSLESPEVGVHGEFYVEFKGMLRET